MGAGTGARTAWHLAADPQPKILRGIAEITAALTNGTVDCLDMTTDEYFALQGTVAMQNCVVAVKGHSITEEYVLLVNRNSGIERLSDCGDTSFSC